MRININSSVGIFNIDAESFRRARLAYEALKDIPCIRCLISSRILLSFSLLSSELTKDFHPEFN